MSTVTPSRQYQQQPNSVQPSTPPRIGFISLGCPKALVDSERILTELKIKGYHIVNTYQQADLVIVNTCGFIDAAKAESIQTIQEALKEQGRVIVTGCLSQQADEFPEILKEVLAITGPQAYEAVVAAVQQHAPFNQPYEAFTDLVPSTGVKLTPRHYAYLKISEGCNHQCSFCIIPDLRGKLVSRTIGEVMQEAEALVRAGVKEILVISQDTSAYGVDLKYQMDFWQGRPLKTQFQTLCETLGELGIWVRLHYVYPYPHVDKVIPLMADQHILPYLDIPFQHASPKILKAMKRPAHAENVLRRIEHWRSICPEITIRSTFIVGFPGETEEDFDTLLAFLKAAQLDRVGCFQYSPVKGAKANVLPGAVEEETKAERFEMLMALQNRISADKMQQKIGKNIRVLIDEVSGTGVMGRSAADAPEIDGLVHIKTESPHSISVGDWVDVSIEEADEYDLFATL